MMYNGMLSSKGSERTWGHFPNEAHHNSVSMHVSRIVCRKNMNKLNGKHKCFAGYPTDRGVQ